MKSPTFDFEGRWKRAAVLMEHDGIGALRDETRQPRLFDRRWPALRPCEVGGLDAGSEGRGVRRLARTRRLI
jgi:hypothetical protein